MRKWKDFLKSDKNSMFIHKLSTIYRNLISVMPAFEVSNEKYCLASINNPSLSQTMDRCN